LEEVGLSEESDKPQEEIKRVKSLTRHLKDMRRTKLNPILWKMGSKKLTDSCWKWFRRS
jgi:hypothetical protein